MFRIRNKKEQQRVDKVSSRLERTYKKYRFRMYCASLKLYLATCYDYSLVFTEAGSIAANREMSKWVIN